MRGEAAGGRPGIASEVEERRRPGRDLVPEVRASAVECGCSGHRARSDTEGSVTYEPLKFSTLPLNCGSPSGMNTGLTPKRRHSRITRDSVRVDRAARLLAMQNLSTADASINCWNDKYHWDFWRPWNAIPRGASDGNPATEPRADWAALISAPYPEHPSGHLCLDGGSIGVLRMFFGNRIEGGFDITSASALLQPTDERTRRFSNFSRVLAEVVEARIWAGLHYRTPDKQGKVLGLRVAQYAGDHFAQ